MLKSSTSAVTALAGRFDHSSGTFGHQRRYICSVESLNFFGTVTYLLVSFPTCLSSYSEKKKKKKISGKVRIHVSLMPKKYTYRIYPKYSSEYLRTPKNYQSSRVFTGIYAVTFPYIPIGVKINNLFNCMLFFN